MRSGVTPAAFLERRVAAHVAPGAPLRLRHVGLGRDSLVSGPLGGCSQVCANTRFYDVDDRPVEPEAGRSVGTRFDLKRQMAIQPRPDSPWDQVRRGSRRRRQP
jgi:hypothetical protein